MRILFFIVSILELVLKNLCGKIVLKIAATLCYNRLNAPMSYKLSEDVMPLQSSTVLETSLKRKLRTLIDAMLTI
jgi:hypothetical protein